MAASSSPRFSSCPVSNIVGTRLPRKSASSLWDVSIENGKISNIRQHDSMKEYPDALDARGALLTPSFCHAHIHLDKCFLLQDEKYSDLEIINGDFAEAMKITGQAKQRFEHDDLMRRGRRLIEESISSGVTAMRAFVEVDEVVGLKCLDAGINLKQQYEQVCFVQICAFAQLALFSGDDGGKERRRLMQEAIGRPGVDVIGSTPYVEDNIAKMKDNVKWTIENAISSKKHLDFHLDYNLDRTVEPFIWHVLEELKRQDWSRNASRRTICLGHCTRLTMLTRNEWQLIQDKVAEQLPITFVGLPTSDLFMMGRPEDEQSGGGERPRGTLQIPQMITEYGLRGALSINNIANAFTPYGSCDPLKIASLGVGIYQAGTKMDAEILFETVSSYATSGIGCEVTNFEIRKGDPANLVLFYAMSEKSKPPTILGLVHQGGEKCRRVSICHGNRINCI